MQDTNKSTATATSATLASGVPQIWQVEISPLPGNPNLIADETLASARLLQIDDLELTACHGFLIQGDLNADDVEKLTGELLFESVVQKCEFGPIGTPLTPAPAGQSNITYVLPLPGVTDSQAESAMRAMKQLGYAVDAVSTFKKYYASNLSDNHTALLQKKVLHNESIERVITGVLQLERLDLGNEYKLVKTDVPLTGVSDDDLMKISKDWTLSLSLTEMHVIRDHFEAEGRAPTDIELESVAQTWSEHCSHKTLAGRVAYTDENGTRQYDNMLKETIFAATMQIREDLGDDDWCVSVFKDNAGIVRFRRRSQRGFQSRNSQPPVSSGTVRWSQHGHRRSDS